MYTREEFEELRTTSAQKMAADKKLESDARDLLVAADRYNWAHQTTWFGEPALNLPTDLFAIQEIIFRTRPKYIVEVGVAWGGAMLFYATLLEVLGGEKVIGVDRYMPDDLKTRLNSHGRISSRLVLLDESSLEANTIEKVGAALGGSRETLVILDSNHTHDHVLQELRLYSPFVGEGHYLVVCDTIVEDIPTQTHRPREWGPGNNPKTALDQFMRESGDFEVDRAISAKLLLSSQPGGYLRRVRSGER